MAYIPNSGSVVAFQSDPNKLVGTVSVVGNLNSSVAVVSTVPASVSGVGIFNVNHVGNGSILATLTNSSVTALQGTNPWITQPTSGSVFAYQAAGSIMAVAATVTTGPSSVQLLGGSNSIGSVTAFQGTNPWIVGNSSVMLTAGTNVIGSVAALQGSNPWIVQLTSGSVITAGGNSSVQVVGTMPPQSVSGIGTFNIDPVGAGSIIAKLTNSSVTALQGTNPWIVGNSSVTVMGTVPASVSGVGNFNVVPVGSIAGTYLEKNAVTASALGIPVLFKIDETNSVLSAVSPQSPFPIRGSVAALQGTNPWVIGNSSVMLTTGTNVVGSVAALQGTNPWQVNVPTPSLLSIQPGGSVLNANISGSVAAAIINFTASVAANINVISASIITNQGTNPWVIGSIVGTYAGNSARVQADKGIQSLNLRNDTLSSITSADNTYSPLIVGPTGEVITANSPITKWWSAQTSVMYGTSVQAFAPQGASIFTYITGINVANDSATFSRVKITGGNGSVLAWTVAPANGGSNINFLNGIKTGENSGVSASINGVSSVYVTMTGFISKT